MLENSAAPCGHLEFVFRFEIEHGNTVAIVREVAGRSRLYFAQDLKIWGTPATAEGSRDVEYWDSGNEVGLTVDEWEAMADPPQIEAGWRCKVHGHIVAGPRPRADRPRFE